MLRSAVLEDWVAGIDADLMTCPSCSFNGVPAAYSLTEVEVIDTNWLSSSSSCSVTPSNRCNRVAASVFTLLLFPSLVIVSSFFSNRNLRSYKNSSRWVRYVSQLSLILIWRQDLSDAENAESALGGVLITKSWIRSVVSSVPFLLQSRSTACLTGSRTSTRWLRIFFSLSVTVTEKVLRSARSHLSLQDNCGVIGRP